MYFIFNEEIDTFITFNQNETTELLYYLISICYKDLNEELFEENPINEKKRKCDIYYNPNFNNKYTKYY